MFSNDLPCNLSYLSLAILDVYLSLRSGEINPSLFMMTVIAGNCTETLPSDYDSSFGSYCNWTCQEWANNGWCNANWYTFDQCVTVTSGKIKDYCTCSCNNFGKYPFICKVPCPYFSF